MQCSDQRQGHHRQRKTGKTASCGVECSSNRNKDDQKIIQLLTNSCKHTCVGSPAAEQPIQSM